MRQDEHAYVAFCDDGHDFFELRYRSKHRAKSKANLEDAYMSAPNWRWRRHFKIKNTMIDKERD